ncbi:MAG: IS4/IS5 family transposase [Bacteroidetes bacterium]|nr:IS4/IS5 family transposase [Bacteroidota bacterium]
MAKGLRLSDIEKFADQLFGRSDEVRKGSAIMKGILDSRSARLSDISQAMKGNPQANYKAIHRFLQAADPQEALLRLYWEQAPYILADPTEIARPQAKRTAYVGRLKDGKTRGFWLLLLGTPYRGRVVPFHFISYSSRTIAKEATSRNQEHNRAFAKLREMIGNKPLVLDREFSYEGLLEDLVVESINFVIRLNISNGVSILDEEKKPISLTISPGQTVYHKGVYYRGKVRVNLVGYWKPGLSEPLWLITSLECEAALETYRARMSP